MNRIWLLTCRLLPRMHLARSYFNGLQKSYDPMAFLHTSGDAKKARHHLVRMTETCNQLVSSHLKYESDLLPTGDIWRYDSSLAANPQRIWCLVLTFKYSYCLNRTFHNLLMTFWHVPDESMNVDTGIKISELLYIGIMREHLEMLLGCIVIYASLQGVI